jgi:hypothetical protein
MQVRHRGEVLSVCQSCLLLALICEGLLKHWMQVSLSGCYCFVKVRLFHWLAMLCDGLLKDH